MTARLAVAPWVRSVPLPGAYERIALKPLTTLPDALGDREPPLAQLAVASVSGLPPAGPEVRKKPLTIILAASTGPKVVRPFPPRAGGPARGRSPPLALS